VHKAAIYADGQELDSQSLELGIAGSDRCQLRRSNKSKVTRVETDDDPLSSVIGKVDGFESHTSDKRIELEIGGFFAYLR